MLRVVADVAQREAAARGALSGTAAMRLWAARDQRPAATAALLLLLAVIGTRVPAFAHPDTLGAPDPQWQRFPGAPAETDTQRAMDDGAQASGDGMDSAAGDARARRDGARAADDGGAGSGLRVLETVVYGLATLAALLALSLVRSFRGRRAPEAQTEHGGDSRERA